jgi:DNA-binding CsgD family transcriptional regulator/ketosteroid isomerase-like protein
MTAMANTLHDLTKVPTDDHKAIVDVIYRETDAFRRVDFEAWQTQWLHDDRTRDVCISATAGLSVLSGWPAIAAHMKQVMEGGFNSPMVSFSQENLQISVSGDVAWVVYEDCSTFTSGNMDEMFETRILERHKGQWKIVYSSFVPKYNDGPGGKSVGVDRAGKIVRANLTALETLKQHPLLTVSTGQLRAHRLDWDKELQSAISHAAKHHGFFETHHFANEMGAPVRYPVILGHTDEGGMAVTQISVKDCVTYVRLDIEDDLDRRLKFAQAVFGLSDGQTRVARHIALGEGPKDLAVTLGISINTVRTHLSRLYEKTGVSTQAALIRLLLSVG